MERKTLSLKFGIYTQKNKCLIFKKQCSTELFHNIKNATKKPTGNTK